MNESSAEASVVSSHIGWLLPECLSNFQKRRWEPLCPHQCLLEVLCKESEGMEPEYAAGTYVFHVPMYTAAAALFNFATNNVC